MSHSPETPSRANYTLRLTPRRNAGSGAYSAYFNGSARKIQNPILSKSLFDPSMTLDDDSISVKRVVMKQAFKEKPKTIDPEFIEMSSDSSDGIN